MNIADKVVLITGSSHRVGRAIAVRMASCGAKVVIHYHTQQHLAGETAKLLENLGAKYMTVKGDVSKRSDWERMTREIIDKWGRIDVLVNNAAIFYKTPVFDVTETDWDNFQDINLKGSFLGCQIVGLQMTENKCGKIINIADVSAETVWTQYIPYCISKAGIVALTKGMAKALAPYVTVNAVAPGTVLLAENYNEQEENMLIERTPLKRIGSPEDIAETIRFLVEGSDFITGEIIKVDGGRSLT